MRCDLRSRRMGEGYDCTGRRLVLMDMIFDFGLTVEEGSCGR